MTEAERLVQELQGESEWLRSPTQTDSVWMEQRLKLTADLCVEAADLIRSQAAEIEAALPIVREYARANPKHYWRDTMQDPCGAHAWLARNDPDVASAAARKG